MGPHWAGRGLAAYFVFCLTAAIFSVAMFNPSLPVSPFSSFLFVSTIKKKVKEL